MLNSAFSFSPLWRIDPKEHLLNLIRDGFDTIITGVAALGLDESWLGRRLDGVMVEELVELQRKHGMHAALEGGEGETFVLDCPVFKERIEITSSKKHWDGMAGYLEILEARLGPEGYAAGGGGLWPRVRVMVMGVPALIIPS